MAKSNRFEGILNQQQKDPPDNSQGDQNLLDSLLPEQDDPEREIRLNVEIPKSMHDRIKVEAAKRGTTHKQIVIACLKHCLGED